MVQKSLKRPLRNIKMAPYSENFGGTKFYKFHFLVILILKNGPEVAKVHDFEYFYMFYSGFDKNSNFCSKLNF